MSHSLSALQWRCIGPSRGGRVVAVAGDPQRPMTFYFGACAGGVWKTEDGGVYWRNVSDGFLGTAAIGAMAVSRSDPNVVYAGTGETTIRLDVSYGDGLYRSTDAGRTWRHIGLRESKFIGRVVVHPADPDHVYVAVLGDAFGPNPERGVYRTRDGGTSWELVLKVDADTGAVDISMDAQNPRILFASMWQARRSFWHLSSGGPGCGLYRSTDGGDTWTKVSTRPGFATGLLGKIGVAVSPVRAGRVWALVEAGDGQAGLYRSDNHGDSWTLTSPNRDLMHRPWYYMHVFACTGHADTVYVTNLQMWKSTDGGVSFSEITTPHGDNHDLWIDPANPQRMVQGNDGGANVSFNGGYTWSSIYNQLTAQFYRMDIDDQFPYRVYATQQDNTSISVPSASEWGVIRLDDSTYPGTGESGFIAVDPRCHDVVYVGAVGSSPGGAGALQRYDHRTRQMQLVNVWPEDNTGYAPKALKYRFAWTFPIVFSPHEPGTLYAGGNHVFRSRDEGMSWEEISPDLSRNDESKLDYSGGPLTRDSAGAEMYASCASVVESPHRKGEIWASTDDGLVHVTRDDGKSWTNVTPPAMPEWAYVGCVEISAQDADTVYVAATCYKLADYRPYLFRTTDGGKTWASANGDLPAHEITRVVRADPEAGGLLFVGTETGIFFSTDDGAHWRRMNGRFPVVPVYDLKIKNGDLVAATHGRSFWVLDDITPLRQMAAEPTATTLFTPRTAIRTKWVWSAGRGSKLGVAYGPAFGVHGSTEGIEMADGGFGRRSLDVGENPPQGATLYYWLAEAAPVTLVVKDSAGAEVARFVNGDKGAASAKKPAATPGLNRFVWDLRHAAPARLDLGLRKLRQPPLAAEGDGTAGPHVVPGRYTVELTVGGKTQSVPIEVAKDPRVATTADGFAAQYAQLRALCDTLGDLNRTVNRIRTVACQLDILAGRLGDGHAALRDQAIAIGTALAAVEGVLVDVKRESPRDVLRHEAGLDDTLNDMIAVVSTADAAPTLQARQVSEEAIAKVRGELAKADATFGTDLATLNRALAAAGLAHLGVD